MGSLTACGNWHDSWRAAITVPGASMLAAWLVVYQIVYYLLPLLVASFVAMFIDLRIRKAQPQE